LFGLISGENTVLAPAIGAFLDMVGGRVYNTLLREWFIFLTSPLFEIIGTSTGVKKYYAYSESACA
jgi:hypothetical protein